MTYNDGNTWVTSRLSPVYPVYLLRLVVKMVEAFLGVTRSYVKSDGR